MEQPIFRVIKKVVYDLGGLHGLTATQMNAQIARFIDEENVI